MYLLSWNVCLFVSAHTFTFLCMYTDKHVCVVFSFSWWPFPRHKQFSPRSPSTFGLLSVISRCVTTINQVRKLDAIKTGRKDGANVKSFDLKGPFGKRKRRDCAGDSTKIEWIYAPACHASCLYLVINDGLDFSLQRQYSVSGLTCLERGRD